MKKTISLLLVFAQFATGYSQEIDKDEFDFTQVNSSTISVQSFVSVDAEPDIFSIEVYLSEYDDVNPQNQITRSVKMDEIESEMFNRLKEFGLSREDCELQYISDLSINNNINYNVNYTTTKKKILKKSYVIELLSSDQIEQVISGLKIQRG